MGQLGLVRLNHFFSATLTLLQPCVWGGGADYALHICPNQLLDPSAEPN